MGPRAMHVGSLGCWNSRRICRHKPSEWIHSALWSNCLSRHDISKLNLFHAKRRKSSWSLNALPAERLEQPALRSSRTLTHDQLSEFQQLETAFVPKRAGGFPFCSSKFQGAVLCALNDHGEHRIINTSMCQKPCVTPLLVHRNNPVTLLDGFPHEVCKEPKAQINPPKTDPSFSARHFNHWDVVTSNVLLDLSLRKCLKQISQLTNLYTAPMRQSFSGLAWFHSAARPLSQTK